MKKIFLVLATGIAMISCNEADKTAENSTNNSTSTLESVSANTSAAANTSTAQIAATDTSTTSIEWLDGTTRNMGSMKSGDKLDVVFRFKNTGTKPLIIKAVNPKCGCTASEKPTKPFAPGETGEIKAGFDSNGQGTGSKSKAVDVIANTNPELTQLTFNVNVKPKS